MVERYMGSTQTPESIHVFATMTSPSSSVMCLKYIAFPLYGITSAHFLQFCWCFNSTASEKNEIWLQPMVRGESSSFYRVTYELNLDFYSLINRLNS